MSMSHEEEQRWAGYYRSLRSWADYLIGPRLRRRLDESDLVQEAWAAAWESQDQYQGSTPQEREAWLRGILRNMLAKSLRSHSAQKRSLDREIALPSRLDQSWANVDAMFFGKEPGPSQQLEGEERLAQFMEAVAGLTEKEQTVIRLRLFDGLKLAELAERIGETEGSVAGRLARATRKLRQRLAGVDR